MKKIVFSFLYLLFVSFINSGFIHAQRVYPLVSGITVDSLLLAQPGATKIAMESISGHLFYTTVGGDIYEVYIPGTGNNNDSLRYTAADHGITYLQGLYFKDSVMFLCGNIWGATTSVGKVVKATLQPNGTRIFTDVVTTVPYPSASSTGDHGFAGVNIDPAGNYIYVSSGARTHLGEIRTNGGAWPGKREVPLTTRIFKFPVSSVGIVLPNDSTLIDNSGYVFAWGTRNAYDMAWDSNDTLFAIDNSGERDDPEELNWMRQGHHYGYPWKMGGNYNPLMVSPYDVNLDPLVNHLSGGYINGWFADDPTFPAVPGGVTFTEPVRNYGTVADYYRDSITGQVKNATDEGTYIPSFTPHRSPLGLVFDRDSLLSTPFRGNGFVLSFMPGGDSIGYTPLSPWGSPCPFVDPSRELVQLKLTYNSAIDNYTMTTSNIVEGFYLPVDAELVANTMYVIENGGSIWKINFPLYVNVQEYQNTSSVLVYPNPVTDKLNIDTKNKKNNYAIITITNIVGETVMACHPELVEGQSTININQLTKGIYFVEIKTEKGTENKKLVVQ